MNVPLNIDWQQIILHLLNFVILFAILYFLLYEPVKKFMDKRTQYYKDIDNEAYKYLQQAESSKNEYIEKLKAVDAEIEQKRQKAQQSITNETTRSLLSAKKEAEEIISNAYRKAENERNKLLESAQSEIAEMVTSATEKIVLKSSTAESYEQFLTAVERGGENE